MTYYHLSKNAALEAGAQFEPYWTVSAELVSYNGWVIVLRPRSLDVLNWPLAPLMEVAEVEFPNRLRKRPTSYKRIAQPSAPKAVREPGEPGQAPTKGATGRVWEIADKVTAEKGGTIDRGAIIAACEAAGINPATAATQFSKWRRARSV